MKILFLFASLCLAGSVFAGVTPGKISWEKAQAYPMADVVDHRSGPLKGKGVFSGQDVLVKMEPARARNRPYSRMNGGDVAEKDGKYYHRLCHNRITELFVIQKPLHTSLPVHKPVSVAVWQNNDLAVVNSAAASAPVSDMMLASTRFELANASTARTIGAVLVGGGLFALGQSLIPASQLRVSQQVTGGGGSGGALAGNTGGNTPIGSLLPAALSGGTGGQF